MPSRKSGQGWLDPGTQTILQGLNITFLLLGLLPFGSAPFLDEFYPCGGKMTSSSDRLTSYPLRNHRGKLEIVIFSTVIRKGPDMSLTGSASATYHP